MWGRQSRIGPRACSAEVGARAGGRRLCQGVRYDEQTKHHSFRYAGSPGYLGWANHRIHLAAMPALR